MISPLGPAGIQKAIAFGAEPTDRDFATSFVSRDPMPSGKASAIRVTTPSCRIAAAAADAGRKNKPFGPANVTAGMKAPVAEAIVEALLPGVDSAVKHPEHAVLVHRDAGGKAVMVQPTSTKPLADGFVAVFPLAALRDGSEIRVLYRDGEQLAFHGGEIEECDVEIRARIAARRIAAHETQEKERRAAADARVDPRIAALVLRLKGENPIDRAMAADLLAGFGPEARIAVPDLIAALSDPALVVRTSAVKALGAIGPEARDAVPALEGLSQDGMLRFPAADALAKIRKVPTGS